jgi:hypothetical protein
MVIASAHENIFFFEKPATRVCRACINREEAITNQGKRKKNKNNLTEEATTTPLPQETQSPQSSKATASERHSARQSAHENIGCYGSFFNWKSPVTRTRTVRNFGIVPDYITSNKVSHLSNISKVREVIIRVFLHLRSALLSHLNYA